jgi:hypothetical protein
MKWMAIMLLLKVNYLLIVIYVTKKHKVHETGMMVLVYMHEETVSIYLPYTEGVCSLTISLSPSMREAQLTCGENLINFHFNNCQMNPGSMNRSEQQCTADCDEEFTPCSNTCYSRERCLDHIKFVELLLNENPTIVDRICPEIQTLYPECLENLLQQCPNSAQSTSSSPTSQTKVMDHTREQDVHVVITSLGVLVGLLLVLLAVVTTGWVYTCWIMRQNKIKSEQVRYVKTVHMN